MYSRTTKEHKDHLRAVLQLLLDNQLYANEKKCHFGQKELDYSGHNISENEVAIDEAKV